MATPHNSTPAPAHLLTGAQIIHASAHFAARRTAAVDAAVATAAEALRAPGIAERRVCQTFEPHVKALPFVAMPDGEPELTIAAPLSYWSPAPGATHQDGRTFARLAVSAVLADADAYRGQPCGRRLEQIIEGIVADAVARRLKGGKGSRVVLTPCADGFLRELSAVLMSAGAAVALDHTAA
jgi:hypothetical protein